MTEPRGSWNLHAGIRSQWNAAKLDEHFKTQWPPDQREDFLALSDGQAEGTPPLPYAVYESLPAQLIATTGGKIPSEQICTYNATVQFTVHAATKPGAVAVAKQIAAAFGPSVALNLAPDAHVQTWQVNDFGVKEGDKHYLWVLEFLIQFEGTYALPPPPSGA